MRFMCFGWGQRINFAVFYRVSGVRRLNLNEFPDPRIEHTVGARYKVRVRKRGSADEFPDPGNRAHRWGTLKNEGLEEGVGGRISGPRKSSTPLGHAKT